MKSTLFATAFCFVLTMAGGCGSDQTAGKTRSEKTSDSAGRSTVNGAELPAEAEDGNQTSDAGLLDRATDLIRKATDSSAEGAETTRKWIEEKINDTTESSSGITEDASEWANNMYNSLKDQGLTTADNTRQWLTEDIRNMSAFEYRIAKIPLSDLPALEDELNELGKSRWECFHAVEQNGDMILFFKKGRRSILKNIPVKDLMKLIPLMGTDAGE